MVTAQKRLEFQMQLLKRARRRAQKKIEYLEDDKNWKEVRNDQHSLLSCGRSVICLNLLNELVSIY